MNHPDDLMLFLRTIDLEDGLSIKVKGFSTRVTEIRAHAGEAATARQEALNRPML